jgi:hypothetical protein
MNTLYSSTLGLVGALALAGTAYAQVPSTNDTSDGNQNTGMGTGALGGPNPQVLTGTDNTASGYQALYSNESGDGNTASGYSALASNTRGNSNTATGWAALTSNTTGNNNTASGTIALEFNTSGSENTAFVFQALSSNTTGSNNTASGLAALQNNTTAINNTAFGYESLIENTTGSNNTANGAHALASNTTGSSNIAEGWHAGYNLTTGSGDIDIGSPGVAAESGVIRIGTTSTQSAAYIAGIYGVTTGTPGMAVVIDSSGKLGTVSSSIRYKEDIQPMAEASERLLQLRPVRFRYKKPDALGDKPIQYGLIAEEVAEVYPELVVRDGTTGRIDGVRYDELAPMLLNEMQQQRTQLTAKIDGQAAEIRDLKQQMVELKDLKQELRAALRKLQSQNAFVAQR